MNQINVIAQQLERTSKCNLVHFSDTMEILLMWPQMQRTECLLQFHVVFRPHNLSSYSVRKALSIQKLRKERGKELPQVNSQWIFAYKQNIWGFG